MPLVRIDLKHGTTQEFRRDLSAAVYEAMRDALKVPENDRFQVITEHPRENLVVDPTYLGIRRSPAAIVVQITLSFGRSVETKQAFYALLVERLAALGVRREDVLVNLVEVAKENWSFGNGVAQYVTPVAEKVPAIPA